MAGNRRKSPFRYVLDEPIEFELYIVSLNFTPAPRKPISAQMHDISRSGCLVSLPVEIPVGKNRIRVALDFVLNKDPMHFEGQLRWAKEEDGRHYYGVEMEVPEDQKDRLQLELRGLAGANRIRVM